MPDVSTLTLNNGVTMPALGLGVFQTPPEETRDAVTAALRAGYRHIDTAAAYGNERQVGEAVRSSGVDRSEVFLETKIWISDYGYDQTLHGFDKSARKLGVDQIDLLILHQALPSQFELTLQAYRGLQTLLGEGKVRAIGVSNFMVDHLTKLLDQAEVVPAVNQIEVHPYFLNPAARDACMAHGIAIEAWSPLGRGELLKDEAITAVARACGRSAAQVVLRWHVQHGHIVFPKSSHPERMAENFDIFTFELTAEQMSTIDGLDRGEAGRVGPHPDTFDWIPSAETPNPR
jgi:diketogulonate reductase-like aldo/keto reductase